MTQGALAGQVTSLALLLWLGMGAYANNVHTPYAPVSTANCNWTAKDQHSPAGLYGPNLHLNGHYNISTNGFYNSSSGFYNATYSIGDHAASNTTTAFSVDSSSPSGWMGIVNSTSGYGAGVEGGDTAAKLYDAG